MPMRSMNGANQIRSRRLASERKSYQLTFHQNAQQQHNFFCITETKIATGQKKVLPSKWQVKPSDRAPLHRIHQPAKSILRRVNATAETSKRSSSSEDGLRFSSRVDKRFYIIGSDSTDQLVKLTRWDGNTLEANEDSFPSSFDLVDLPSSPEPTKDGIEDFIDAVNTGWSIQNIVTMLQKEVDRTHQDPSIPEDWLVSLYYSIKKQQKEECNPSPKSNLAQIHKLLSIYKNAERTINAARALKQWSRFEVTVESISNLHFTNETVIDLHEPLVGEMLYSSDQDPQQKFLGKLPTTEMAPFVDYTMGAVSHKDGARRYCLNHNFGIADERPQLTFNLRQGKQSLGNVVVPCSIFRYFSTQPTKTYNLERAMVSDGYVEAGAKVKFSIRKVNLKPGFLHQKRQEISKRIEDLIDWIGRFNKDNLNSTRSSLLSAHICGQDNVSLLHAAILAQDVRLVQTLMNMGANPYVHSGIGSSMTLALNQSDRRYEKESDKQRFDDIIKIMQGNQTGPRIQQKRDDTEREEKGNSKTTKTLPKSKNHNRRHRSKQQNRDVTELEEKENIQAAKTLPKGKNHNRRHRSKRSSSFNKKKPSTNPLVARGGRGSNTVHGASTARSI